MSEIKPALTAEEWEQARRQHFVTTWHMFGAHGAAALCLEGEPFGFTHEDVDLLEGEATKRGFSAMDDEAFGITGSVDRDKQRRLQSLAARLAALLPPRAE